MFASSVAAADNCWKGVDGADLAAQENWSASALPASAAGYFKKNGTLTEYSACLSKDETFFQFYWQLANLKTVFNLCGNTLTLSAGSNIAAMRLDTNYAGMEATFTNGTITTTGARCGVWVLGDNQTLTFGEGLVFNGAAAIHSGSAHAGSRIIVRDGAKVNGRLYIDSKQKNCSILVSGSKTAVNYNGENLDLDGGSSYGDNMLTISDGAVVTNAAVSLGATDCTNLSVVVDNAHLYATSFIAGRYGVSNSVIVANGGTLYSADDVNIGYSNYSVSGTGSRLVVDSGSVLYTENWATSTGSKNVCLGKDGVAGGNEIYVGDGGAITTRQFLVRGMCDTLSISNGTVSAVLFTFGSGNTLHFAGSSPKLYERESKKLTLGAGCTFVFDIPAGGYAVRDGYANAAPCDFIPSGAVTVPDDTQLVIHATEYAKAGGGTVPLMAFRGAQAITISQTLLDRWNAELAAQNCSVAWDTANRQLTCTVKKPGLVIFVR